MKESGDNKPVFAKLPNIHREPRWNVHVSSVKEVSPDVISLILERPNDFSFVAGQYVWLVLPGRTKKKGAVDRRAYSIASSTSDTHLEFVIRITSSDYTNALRALGVGDDVSIIGPMGSAFVPPDSGAVLISGGTGIAPFLSIVKSNLTGNRFSLYAFEDQSRPLHCKEELVEISKRTGCDVHVYTGQPAVNQFTALVRLIHSRAVFVSGPPGFVDAVSFILKETGISQERIQYEAFYPSSKDDVSIDKMFLGVASADDIEHMIAGVGETSKDDLGIVLQAKKVMRSRLFVTLLTLATTVIGISLMLQRGDLSWAYIITLLTFMFFVIINRSGAISLLGGNILIGAFFTFALSFHFVVDSISIFDPLILAFPMLARRAVAFRQALVWTCVFVAALLGIELFQNGFSLGFSATNVPIIESIFILFGLFFITDFFSAAEEGRSNFIVKNSGVQKELIAQMEGVLRLSGMLVKVSNQTSNHVVMTDRNGRVLYANKAAERLTGYSLREMHGQTPRLWGGLMSAVSYESLWKNKSSDVIVTRQIINRRRDGSLYIVFGRITPILNNGNVIAYVSTEENVTDFVNMDKAKSEFVSLASHQLRTPLSATNWYTEMLLAGDAGEITEKQKLYLEEIYTGNQRMVELIGALLDTSRLELGTFTVDLEKIDVVELVNSVVHEQENQVAAKRLVLSVYVPDAPIIIDADKRLLRIVFQNLLSNAVKYTSELGSITIGLSQEDVNVLLTVKDTGWGIPKNQQDKIFDKLFRADNVTSQDTEGTGLGLYIVKSVVERLNGSIKFESEEGVGTTFYISLPKTQVGISPTPHESDGMV